MNEVIQNMLTRRSIRSYSTQAVAIEDLQTILMAGSYAPNGKGLQNWKITAIQDKTALKKMNEAIRRGYLSYPQDEQSNQYVLSMIEKANNEEADYMYHAPVFVFVSHLINDTNAMADSSLAIGQMMLAAHSLGLGSCWLNHLPRLTNQSIVRELLTALNIPSNHIVYGSFVLGYSAQGSSKPMTRKEVIQII